MKLQIIYQDACFEPSTPDFYNGWLDEMAAMRSIGLSVADHPSDDAERLLFRSFIISQATDFPDDPRYLSRWSDYCAMSDMSLYLPLIEDLTIPSFITQTLDSGTVGRIKQNGWERAFVRSCMKSLKYLFPESGTEEELPVWPEVSIERLAEAYSAYQKTMPPPYIIRKFLPKSSTGQEERYWVLNHHVYHRSGVIPAVVSMAVERLKPLNSLYYVIDATPDYVVELNPGVSSDPYPDNIPMYFPKWIKKEFAAED